VQGVAGVNGWVVVVTAVVAAGHGFGAAAVAQALKMTPIMSAVREMMRIPNYLLHDDVGIDVAVGMPTATSKTKRLTGTGR
jgi:hypothetical protein